MVDRTTLPALAEGSQGSNETATVNPKKRSSNGSRPPGCIVFQGNKEHDCGLENFPELGKLRFHLAPRDLTGPFGQSIQSNNPPKPSTRLHLPQLSSSDSFYEEHVVENKKFQRPEAIEVYNSTHMLHNLSFNELSPMKLFAPWT